jgi:multidrug transporter EmrE-like cation transporter
MLESLSVPLAVLAYTLLSTGLVLQKKGIGWIGTKGEKDGHFYRDLFTWISGFGLMNLYIVPNAAALRFLAPHIVAAMAGWGVIVLVALSSRLLKERIYRSDAVYTALIVAAIILLNLLERTETEAAIRTSFMAAAAAFPLLIGAAAALRVFRPGIRSILFAWASGLSTGMIIVTMKGLVAAYGFEIPAYFSSPYLYLYLIFSLVAFITLQASYRLGDMMAVGPVQYTAAIFYPVLCSVAIFGNRLHLLQWASLLWLAAAVIGILSRRSSCWTDAQFDR